MQGLPTDILGYPYQRIRGSKGEKWQESYGRPTTSHEDHSYIKAANKPVQDDDSGSLGRLAKAGSVKHEENICLKNSRHRL